MQMGCFGEQTRPDQTRAEIWCHAINRIRFYTCAMRPEDYVIYFYSLGSSLQTSFRCPTSQNVNFLDINLSNIKFLGKALDFSFNTAFIQSDLVITGY